MESTAFEYTKLKTIDTETIDGFTAIYKVTNKINGKFYIGVTRDFNARRWEHECRARHECKTAFHRALKKYGKENFQWEILWYAVGYFEALGEEQRLIRILQPDYNLTSGGGGVFGLKHSEESKKKMSAAKKGKPSPNRGKIWPQEFKDKVSRTLQGRSPSEGTLVNLRALARAKRKPIRCLNDGRIYSCSAEAAKNYGLRSNQPSGVARGYRRHIKGLRFEWVHA